MHAAHILHASYEYDTLYGHQLWHIDLGFLYASCVNHKRTAPPSVYGLTGRFFYVDARSGASQMDRPNERAEL